MALGDQTGAPPPNTGAGICGYRSSSPKAPPATLIRSEHRDYGTGSHVTGTAATLLGPAATVIPAGDRGG